MNWKDHEEEKINIDTVRRELHKKNIIIRLEEPVRPHLLVFFIMWHKNAHLDLNKKKKKKSNQMKFCKPHAVEALLDDFLFLR